MTSTQASDDVGSIVEPTSSLAWADVILSDFQRVISRYLQKIRIYFFYTAERMLRIIIMQNSKLIQACFPIKIDEVWIDRFCVRYDWWRRLQPTSSVSPVCITNDLPSVVDSQVRLFADGCLVYHPIRSKTDQVLLQWDLSALELWGDTWGMRFNATKCNIMRISRSRNPLTRMYSLCNHVLSEVDTAKYLGIRVLASPKFLPTDNDLCSCQIRRIDRNRRKKVILWCISYICIC